ncbi:hypothetical protein [Kribbella sp. NPDC006257]|uniref:hypothetical protein n=1 Tax=Kribbella sp. NPDC006257 TaxID=3156738 RepID=UPI0033BC3C15
MVGRFNPRLPDGGGDHDWLIWDNAANGQRGSGLTKQQAAQEAADLELQYDAHGYRDKATVRTVDPPVPVEVFQPAGRLDAWVRENGEWIGRVRRHDGEYTWIPHTDLRRIEDQ